MFNAALIAKLTWMVASKRLSPCIVALRNKYKVTADWLREEPLKYASKTWKAIERMKILINNGACFLVGDGESIDVWKEPWVPWLHNFTPKPKYPSMILSPLKVADLIDNNSRSWNLRRIQELFDAESAEAISKIKIPATPIDDKLIWILDPKGKFSVKSVIRSAQGQVSAHDGVNWNGLWKLRIHERYKVLIWRIATGILPTKVNLALKLGSGDTLCPLCSEYDESIEHIFFHCAISRAIWFGNSWAVYSNHLTFSSCKDIINIICDPSLPSGMSMDGKMLKEQTAIQFAITLDVIWNLRNQNLVPLEVRGCVVWEAPPIGVIKINVDAAIYLDKSFMAAVARDYKGELIKAWAKTTVYKDPTIAEADAICWALELAKTEKFEKISIESDAKVCVDALLSPTDDCPWKIRTFTSLALELAVYFSVCSFYWVKRDANHIG
uniref:Reverse transcriptase zinc-binding domain-containing protein n=1 Tax=Fagus sylvatica TaxID=28930 RepID=A0A2N9EDK3_FAGSY